MNNIAAGSAWERIRELFAKASELPPEEREQFLVDQCNGDEGVCAEVRKLLAIPRREPAFLEKPLARLGKPLENVPASKPLLTTGDMIEGRFRIENEIGSGGFSCVYLAIDTQLHGKKVIVKVMRSGSDDQWMSRRFAAEVEALARINDPAVVSVIGYGQSETGVAYVIMQYIEGVTMRVLMTDQPPPWPLDRVIRFMEQIAGALAAVHKEGICHRDLRPENIMVRNPGQWNEQAVIIDFGIATIAKKGVLAATTRVVGSPEYMAPEQLLGRPTPASDVYSLGTLAFELLSGRKLHSCDMPAGPRPVIDSVLTSMPDNVKAALDRAVRWDERSRFQTVKEFAHALSAHTDVQVWRPPDCVEPDVTGTKGGTSDMPGACSTSGSNFMDPESLTQAFRLQSQASVGSSNERNPDSLTEAFRISSSSDEPASSVRPIGPTPPVIAPQEASAADPTSLTAAFRMPVSVSGPQADRLVASEQPAGGTDELPSKEQSLTAAFQVSGKVAPTPIAHPVTATRKFITSRETSADPESLTAFEPRGNTPRNPTKSSAGNSKTPTEFELEMFKDERRDLPQLAHTPQGTSTPNASASTEVQSILNNGDALFQNVPAPSDTPDLHRNAVLGTPALEPRLSGGPSEYTKIVRFPQPSACDSVAPPTPVNTGAESFASNRKTLIAIALLSVIALIGIVVFWLVLRP